MGKKYEEYQQSNVQWIEKVPKHWKWVRNKDIFYEQKELVGDNNSSYVLLSLTKNGIIVRDVESGKGKFPKNYDTYKAVKKGDMIFCLFDVDETPRTVGLSNFDGMITGAYNVFKVRDIASRYAYFYYLALDNIKALKPLYSGLRKVVPIPKFMSTQLPVPPKSEQDQIVRYLDWKTAEIDRLIQQKKKQIVFLEEYEKSTVDNAVSRGIKKNREMKLSGLSWIDQIPTDWDIIPSKHLFKERKELRHENDVQCTASQKYGIISQVEYMSKEKSRVVVADQGLDNWKHVETNDFVISLRSFQGGIERSLVTGCVTWHYIVLRPNKDVNPDFYRWLFKSRLYIKALQTTSEFIRDGQDLRYSNFVKVPLLKIPVKEQQKIADYLANIHDNINKMITAIDKEISLLEELRTKLIADVVTGQIDVRDEVIPDR